MPGLHAALAEEGSSLRRGYEFQECLSELWLLRRGEQGRGEFDGLVQFLRQRADVVGALDREDNVDLLQPEFDLAFGDDFRHGNAVDEFRLGLELIGDAEFLHRLRRDEAAAAAGIPDRFGLEHRSLESLDCADVRPLRSCLYGDAHAGLSEIRLRSGNHLAVFYE